MSCETRRIRSSNSPYLQKFRRVASRNNDTPYPLNLLKSCFETLKGGGQSAGTDNLNFNSLSHLQWDNRLKKMCADIKHRRYRPTPTRSVLVPKNGGGSRRLQIPTILDRVASRACLTKLEGSLENLFVDWSFGFRPERSTLDVFANLKKDVTQGLTWFKHYDIANAFDNVRIRPLLNMIKQLDIDNSTKDLADIIVKGTSPHRVQGINQGDPLSGALFNLYLHVNHDSHLINDISICVKLYRYADDLIIVGSSEEAVTSLFTKSSSLLSTNGMNYSKVDTANILQHPITILGLTLLIENNRLSFSLPRNQDGTETFWDELDDSLENAHTKENPVKTIKQVLRGSLEAKAPVEFNESDQCKLDRVLDKHGINPINIQSLNHTNHWIRAQRKAGTGQ